MNSTSIFQKTEKCSNYTVLTMLIANTITSLKRFKSIPRSTIINETYNALKKRANK